MKKKLLLVLFPVVLLMAGAFSVWGNEQNAVQPGCNKCAKVTQQAPCPNCPKGAAIEQGAAAPCPNCPKAAAEKGSVPCPNCPKAAAQGDGAPCPNCPIKGADAKPAECDKCVKGAAVQPGCAKCPQKGADAAPAATGCSKCAKLQQPDQQPAAQPVQKGCCKKTL